MKKGEVPEGVKWGNVQIRAFFALINRPFTALHPIKNISALNESLHYEPHEDVLTSM
jgi:hypothetical protein